MKRSFNLLLLPFMVLLVSCVHQFPEEDFSRIPFSLNLHFDTDMPIYTEIIHTKSVQEMADVRQMHDVRYVVNAYKVGSTRDISRVPNESFVFTKPYIGNLDNTVEINLPEGEYEFKIWADYVDTGSQDDKYYDTSDFSERCFYQLLFSPVCWFMTLQTALFALTGTCTLVLALG